MSDWLLLIAAVVTGSAISLIGGIYLLYAKWGAQTLQLLAIPFAAGALLAAAFLDLLPEAIEHSDPRMALLYALGGLLVFFVLERSLSWFHHHHDHIHESGSAKPRRRNSSLIVIGDTLHNFIDGLAIGAAFLVDPAVGLITTAAIAAHEIPQEIGDFGLLLSKGMSRRRVLVVNLVSSIATIVAAVAVYGFGENFGLPEDILLAMTAGFFIYIAASDIIPTIHAEPRRAWANLQTLMLILGIIIVGLAAQIAHQVAPPHDDYETSEHANEP